MHKTSRRMRRLKKLLWMVHAPSFVDNQGVKLPLKHAAISEGIRKNIYFGEYEAKEVEIVSRRLTEDDVVMEVGAGIGFLSAFCAKRVGGERVFAYEANPALLPVIAATHRANGVAPTVKNVMLGRGAGTRTFYLEREFWASSLIKGSPDAQAIEVPQVDLNAELAAVAPTFLIVDIEGGEAEFFAAVELPTVRKICIEVHPGVLSDAQISQIFARLFAAGFALDFSLIRKNVFYLYRPDAVRGG